MSSLVWDQERSSNEGRCAHEAFSCSLPCSAAASAMIHTKAESRRIEPMTSARLAGRSLASCCEGSHVAQHLPRFFFGQNERNKRRHRRALAAVLQDPE